MKFISAMNKPTLAIIIFVILSLTSLISVQAQDDTYYSTRFIRNDNAVYRENIRTVLMFRAGFELSPPIMRLNSIDRLVLSFDELNADIQQYKYTVIHCDANWNKSDLQQIEYINGFMEEFIEDYRSSFNTTIPYVNYFLEFPTENLQIKKSGNYIIKVYLDSDQDENVILTQRFMVYEPKVNVEGKVAKAMDLDLRYTHHQIDFGIVTGSYYLTDPFKNLHVMIMQNGRWDNMIMNIQPKSIMGNVFNFNMMNELAFPAGNEYRYFDMKTLKYNTDRMQSLQYTREGYQVFIMTDKPRNKGNYYFEEDINGRKLIAANETRDPYSEGDYAWVHFLLPYWPVLAEGNLYVSGAMADWQYKPSNLMTYNFDLKAYEAKILLKQGYYNYEYVFLEDRSKVGDASFIEGSYWETRNEYTIFVYHRQSGDSYDQLVGIGFINSTGQ